MANRFWVNTAGGTWDNSTTANWSLTTGGTSGASVPGSSDTAIFDGSSGSATITTNYAVSISALTLDTGFAGTVTFGATNTFTTSGLITFTSGTLNTNGQTVNTLGFTSVNSNVRTLTLGSSAITCTGGGTNWNFSTATNLVVTNNTATVTENGAAATFNGPINWNGLSLILSGSGAATITGSCTLANVTRTGTAVTTDSLIIGASTVTVTSSLTLTGNTIANRLLVLSSTLGTQRTIALGAAGTGTLNNVDFQDIQATGTHTPFTGTSLGDALGNTNITTDTPTTRYWIGGTGNWSDIAHWSTSSGGSSGTSIPLPQDSVVFDNNSGNAMTFTVDMPRLGKDIDFSARTNGLSTSAAPSGTVTIFGSLNLNGPSWSSQWNSVTTFSGRGSHTITSGGRAMNGNVTFSCFGGTYTLQDTFSSNSAVTLSNGTLNTNNQACSWGSFGSSNTNTRALTLGTSIITITGTTGNIWNIGTVTNSTLSASSSTIIFSDTGSVSKNFNGGGNKVYGAVTVVGGGTGAFNFNASATTTFSTIRIGAPKTVTVRAASTVAFTSLFITSSAGNIVTLTSDTPGLAGTLSQAAGLVSCDYLALTDSAATGGALFYAGANSTGAVGAGNSGWLFRPPPARQALSGLG